MEKTGEWLKKVTRGDSVRRIAAVSGIAQPTLARQLSSGPLPPETVVKIARNYGVPVMDGLVAIGLVTAKEVGALSLTKLTAATDEQLVAEVERRLKLARGDRGVFDEPISQAVKRKPRG